MPKYNHTYREEDGVFIPGTYLKAFIKNGTVYHATEIMIFKDGAIYCWEWVDFNGLKKKMEEGWVRTQLPEGASVSIGHTSFKAMNVNLDTQLEEKEFVKQVEDEIRFLNNQPTRWKLCEEAIKTYHAEKSDTNRENLKRAIEEMPKHLRIELFWTLGDEGFLELLDLERVDGEILDLFKEYIPSQRR